MAPKLRPASVSALALPRFRKGSVWLAGAGPGDPGLATLLTLHAIEKADVILHDALVNEALLKLARPKAERIYAGKRAGVKSCKQSEISKMLVALARQGKRVLRLKGGDPFVFGRGGEEAEALARARVPFRIVPGVTAGIGGVAYAGIPVTHRDTNNAVTFITGHGSDGHLPDYDWKALGRSSATLVLYMARKNAGEIGRKLIASGRDRKTPVAIIANATFENQSVTVTTLGKLANLDGNAPTIIVIGDNARLHTKLNWLREKSGDV